MKALGVGRYGNVELNCRQVGQAYHACIYMHTITATRQHVLFGIMVVVAVIGAQTRSPGVPSDIPAQTMRLLFTVGDSIATATTSQ